jgi:hypothetical protein
MPGEPDGELRYQVSKLEYAARDAQYYARLTGDAVGDGRLYDAEIYLSQAMEREATARRTVGVVLRLVRGARRGAAEQITNEDGDVDEAIERFRARVEALAPGARDNRDAGDARGVSPDAGHGTMGHGTNETNGTNGTGDNGSEGGGL